jgi:hypothetical protein
MRSPLSRRLGSGSSALPPLPEGHAKRRFGFFRRAISTSFLPMSCSRSRIFFSNSFSWVSLEKTVAPFASYALRA